MQNICTSSSFLYIVKKKHLLINIGSCWCFVCVIACRQERRVYYLHRYKARKFPHKYMAVIDDGMDQQTTNLPNVRRMSKALSGLATIGTHLVGAIVHSGQAVHGKEIYGSFDYYQWPHDSNLNMTVLLNVLSKWSENYKLPPILYLQMDNCWRENKNQFMLALLGLMVQKKIFEKVSNCNFNGSFKQV